MNHPRRDLIITAMHARHYKAFFQYALILSLGVVLILGQAFKLHLHVSSDTGDAPEQIGQLHIAATLHNIPNHSDSRMQNQNNTHVTEIDVGTDGFVKNLELLVLGMLLLLLGILLFRNFKVVRESKRVTDPGLINTSLLYLVIPPLRAPPASLHS